MAASARIKQDGLENDLMDRLMADPDFHLDEDGVNHALDPSRYIGCAVHQTERYLSEVIQPILEKYKDLFRDITVQINV